VEHLGAQWRRRWVAAVFGLAVTAAPAHAADSMLLQISANAKTQTISVAAGKTQSVHTSVNFVDVIVGDSDVADVVPLTDHSLSVLGKKIGATRVSIYAEGKRLLGIFDVDVFYDVSTLAGELAQRFPQAHLRVSSVNGRIMLSGTAPDGPTVDKAVTMARQFAQDKQDIINSVQVQHPQEVLLEVRFVEVSRTASRELGISWDVVGKDVQANLGTAALLSGNAPFGTLMGNLLGHGVQADAIIRALEQREVARRLAEPNLVALSGEPASFLAGGEFPFPVQNNLGQISIEFKRYGVGLAFTPTVLGNNLINLKIEPEVSQLDPTNTVQVGTVSIPSLIVRRASTTVELHDGQSFAIGGLLQNTGQTTQQQLPWIGDVPVLGALFRSALYQKNETDLVIIVTPRLVRPMRPGDVVRTPTQDSLPANDADLFLLGQPEISRPQERHLAGVDVPPVGHILDLPKGTPHVTP
jgi:pilus assembly protein CpaC